MKVPVVWRPALVYFIDRCLGTGDVPNAMRAGLVKGETIKMHDDLLPQGAFDEWWLTLVGNNQWVGLPKDDAIRRRPVQRDALLEANSAIFIFGSAGLSGPRVGAACLTALPRIRRAVARYPKPLIGRINKAGGVSILWADGKELPSPIHIK
jgi:hypothetical protein